MQRVAVPTGETDFTSLQVLSPEEIRIALVCNFVRIHRLGEMSEDDRWAFRIFLMSVPTTFLVMDSVETIFVEAIQFRRDMMKVARLARRSGSQVVDEIMSLWRTKKDGKATAQQLLKLYQENLGDNGKDNDDEDPSSSMTVSMIQAAMTIPKAVKYVPSINAVLIEASEVLMEKSPFFSITNTWVMAKKSNTNDELQYNMEMIFDLCIILPQT